MTLITKLFFFYNLDFSYNSPYCDTFGLKFVVFYTIKKQSSLAVMEQNAVLVIFLFDFYISKISSQYIY